MCGKTKFPSWSDARAECLLIQFPVFTRRLWWKWVSGNPHQRPTNEENENHWYTRRWTSQLESSKHLNHLRRPGRTGRLIKSTDRWTHPLKRFENSSKERWTGWWMYHDTREYRGTLEYLPWHSWVTTVAFVSTVTLVCPRKYVLRRIHQIVLHT